jgi:phosphate transport system permease protein
MATPQQDADLGAVAGTVGRAKGTAFELVCLAATSVGLVAVLILLLFAALDAFRPFSADPGWGVAYLLTVVLPALGLAVYYYRSDEPAGEVAYATAGIPVVGVLAGGAMLVVIAELLTPIELFATVVAVALAVAAILVHGRLRRGHPLEHLGVMLLAPVVALLGFPPDEVVLAIDWLARQLLGGPLLGVRLSSVQEVLLLAPVLPADWILLVSAVTVPVAAAFGVLVARRRESRRAGALLVGGTVAIASAGLVAGPLLGIGAGAWVVLTSFVLPPLVTYVEGVVRQNEGVAGLAFPVVIVGGVILGTAIVRLFGFAPPDPWLDLGFLFQVPSRVPEDAGIYPALVGSVMMMVLIVVAIFPVGVGAAIYLEEYAPSSGLAGKFVTLIEVNIGNLAGVPSVVYGLLGLALFIRALSFPTGTVVVGALAVGLLILPIVIISAQEAIRAVPDTHRQASYGMGATRWQTIRQVVIPQALPGILTGTILALGRAIGETAPLLMVGLAASVRLAPNGFFDLGAAMPRQILSWSSELEAAFRHGVLAAGVVTLVAVLVIMNATAIIIRNKYQRET